MRLRIVTVCCLAALLLAVLEPCLAAELAALARPVECRWADAPITLDGVADEAVWKIAEPIDNFSVPWITPKRAALTATKARLLWDREYLYFFAQMTDSDLYADITDHDGELWRNDVFEIFLKPADQHPGYYEFQANAGGAVLDVFFPRRGGHVFDRFKSDGDFDFQAKVKRQGTLNDWTDKDTGWSVEGRLRWRDFARTGGRPNPGEIWKFAMCRYDYSVDFEGPDLSTCAPLTKANFHRFEDYLPLQFVGPVESQQSRRPPLPRPLPVVASRIIGSPDPPPPYRAVRAYPALELKHPLTFVHEPGTNDLLSILNAKADQGVSHLVRFPDQDAAAETEVVGAFPGIAYGLAFHPRFAQNRLVFVGMNLKPEGREEKFTRVVRYRLDPETRKLDPDSAVTIIEWPSDGHNGGDLGFSPKDGMLYVTSGDGTSDSDGNLTGQDLSNLLGAVLRIDVDRPAADKPYSVPADNPFRGLAGARPEIWAYGLRNPWRMSFDPRSGRLWVGNNGQDLWEQVYLIERGANYGWSVVEGTHPFYRERKQGPHPLSPPAADHPHSEARSLTGGVTYYGDKFPDLRGMYIYGDHSTGKIWGLLHTGKELLPPRELADTSLQITGFGLDTQGELVIVDYAGGLYRLEPTPPGHDPLAFPRKLSETGLFADTPGHEPAPGVIPYSVNSPLWSDGAYKERFIVLPQEKPEIEVTQKYAWKFPELTVFIKSFALEQTVGDPTTRRWIETRLMTLQQGEWVGYTYRWNAEQTDAVLVEAGGADTEFVQQDPQAASGERVQPWRFPSRADCMTCHSRASHFVLGLTTAQLNRDHDYGNGLVQNQLATFEQMGLLKTKWEPEVREAMRKEAIDAGLKPSAAGALVTKHFATRSQRRAVPTTSLLALGADAYPRLADPYDETADLDARARSYLHVNCSICHIGAGGGNSQIDLSHDAKDEKFNVLEVAPLHHQFDLPDARIVAAGAPERSTLLHRMAIRGRGQMPPLATERVDEPAVAMMKRWIQQQQLPVDEEEPPSVD
ncbi:PQQ-dependent sugar dehydrogenase [Lignipirellula cremea]|uniref:Soluble aldose sugar dehydrogenase YliI n=1 Tax=Lignipirellula cremea TaxID=2528010 RepID=A0A518DX95_9BACT|nr:PQQ-dependent sugar dehydrogenase [Lignipirellula cremea]QDU96468.1 Soluble aldose sugar dehydrogenase YliI precursor [Lignipirellula cremea]